MKRGNSNYMKSRMTLLIIFGIIAVLFVAVLIFINLPAFGRLPQGDRLERIEQSPNYRDGRFHNQQPTQQFTSEKGFAGLLSGFFFGDRKGLRPDEKMCAIKSDLHSLPKDENLIVWFGHSSYLLQIDGKRILVDPVFCMAAPVSFVNRPFDGTGIYTPEDMPDIDYLVISHDHWDHLDYQTVKRLKNRISGVICPLGVGEHFERWGFDRESIVEMDWGEDFMSGDDFRVYCLPARHFSGRGLAPNKTLWASFMIETKTETIYVGGDGGYGSHFAEIGKRFPCITLAIIENGQYSENWKHIHTMPYYLEQVITDLAAKKIITVHHSKYALSQHKWDEPLKNENEIITDGFSNLIVPKIGQIVCWNGDIE